MKISTSSDAEQSPPVDQMPADASIIPGVVDGADAAGGVAYGFEIKKNFHKLANEWLVREKEQLTLKL